MEFCDSVEVQGSYDRDRQLQFLHAVQHGRVSCGVRYISENVERFKFAVVYSLTLAKAFGHSL